MQICHIVHKVTRWDLKKPDHSGVALGMARALEQKKNSSKIKTCVSSLRKSKGTPARDTKARTRQENKMSNKDGNNYFYLRERNLLFW